MDRYNLQSWIGKTEQADDVISQRLLDQFQATLADHLFNQPDTAPLAIHWCLAPAAVAPDRLGRDGHPQRGGFLPPVALPRRMWAGGELEFISPLKPLDRVTRRSTIAEISEKQGSSGPLVFVRLAHEFITERGLALRELQNLVYCQPPKTPSVHAPQTANEIDPQQSANLCQPVAVTSTLLFRYSALTFNGHRIHYDADYAQTVEGYPGLVIHGPLQATLLLHYGNRLGAGRIPLRFQYRGLRPLFNGEPLMLNANRTDDGFTLWTSGASPKAAMTADLIFTQQTHRSFL